MFGVNDLYSKRNRPQPSVIEYGPFSKGLKTQLVFIFKDFINNLSDRNGQTDIRDELWNRIDNILRREHMLSILYSEPLYHDLASWYMVCNYFEELDIIDNQLDVVQIIGKHIEMCMSPNVQLLSNYSPEQALADINTRLQEHGMGYRYQSGEIIKVPAQFNYEQAIQPALSFLHQKGFENAQQEFFSAFEHYKKGPDEYEAALTACLKALESTIKIIATARTWTFDQNSTAQPLINLILEKGLIPSYSESFLAGVKNTLLSGVPTIRNKMGAHGKGATTRIVDEATMHYCINLTSSVILYLVQRHQEMP